MSSLENELDLRGKVLEIISSHFPNPQGTYDNKSGMDKIIQAFKDENWVQIPQVELSTRNDNGYQPKAEIFTVNGKEVMTGQEWYNRFKELLDLQFELTAPCNHQHLFKDNVISAAKEAAGL